VKAAIAARQSKSLERKKQGINATVTTEVAHEDREVAETGKGTQFRRFTYNYNAVLS
jgi:hypothetical protein